MKRATLSALPPPPSPAEPPDLTDRLLDREAERAQPAAKRAARPRSAGGRPRRTASSQSAGAAAAPSSPGSPESSEPSAVSPVLETAREREADLAGILRQARAAADALEAAGRQAPARYQVALRYRLEALGYHVRQVTDFVARLSQK
jgi:hypothetical protein